MYYWIFPLKHNYFIRKIIWGWRSGSELKAFTPLVIEIEFISQHPHLVTHKHQSLRCQGTQCHLLTSIGGVRETKRKGESMQLYAVSNIFKNIKKCSYRGSKRDSYDSIDSIIVIQSLISLNMPIFLPFYFSNKTFFINSYIHTLFWS